MSVDYKWANAIMDQLKGCQAENARLREEAAAITTALQKVENLEAEVASLRMALQCTELAGERRRVGGGSSPVDVKSSFISAKTLTAVLEALRSNWFFATDDDEDNNEEVIAATKMLEAEIADGAERKPQATLTDEELDAIEHGLERLELHSDTESRENAATLRNLLNRLGGENERSVASAGSAAADGPTRAEIFAALDTLTRAIGCYGERIAAPFVIRWGNGLIAGLHGEFEAGGIDNVTTRIARLQGRDWRTL